MGLREGPGKKALWDGQSKGAGTPGSGWFPERVSSDQGPTGTLPPALLLHPGLFPGSGGDRAPVSRGHQQRQGPAC